MATDDFHHRSDGFLSWLKQRPGASISPKIRIADKRPYGAGRAIEAVEDVGKDEELFSVSLSDVLSAENSSLLKRIPEAFKGLDPWMSLVLVMIYEAGQRENSTWWPYFNILPEEIDTLMHWTPNELAELQGSAVVKKIGKKEADAAFIEQLLPIVKKRSTLFGDYAAVFAGAHAEVQFLKIAHRMATIVMAYAFDLEEDMVDEDWQDDTSEVPSLPKAMVPLADLLNADGDKNNAHLLQERNRMTMVSLKPIGKGQEIFNDYGQLPRSDLLRRYGYVTDNYNQWDVVEIDVQTVVEVASAHIGLNGNQQETRLQLATDWDVFENGYDLQRQLTGETFQFDPSLLLMIQLFTMDSETLQKVYADGEASNPPSPRFNLNMALVLKQIILRRRDEYSTTLAEDSVLLQDNAVQGRRRMAIEVRLGEKEILASALQAVGEKLRSPDMGSLTHSIPSGGADDFRSKRRKM